MKWSAEGLGWEKRNDDQPRQAAESTPVIKTKTDTVARLPSPYRQGPFDPGASERLHFKMETAHPCRAALSRDLAPSLAFF